MGRFSRRWPLIIGGVWQSCWLFVFAGAGVGGDPEEKKYGTLMIVSAALFIFSYASTWAPGIWILIGETGTRKNVSAGHDPSRNTRLGVNPRLPCHVAIPSGCIGYRFELAVELFDREPNTYPRPTPPRSLADSSPTSQAFFTPFITREINYGYGFVFAGCNLAAAVFTYFFLYESSGISLEMIDAMYSEPGLKPWQSGKWAPEVSLDMARM
jgi:SP family sugar:H+ symporter-like MFS transporter